MNIDDILADYDSIGEAIYMEYYEEDNCILEHLTLLQLEEAINNLKELALDSIINDYSTELREVITNVEFELDKRYR